MNEIIFNFFYSSANNSVSIDKVIVFFAVYFPFLVIAFAFIFLIIHHEVYAAANPVREFFKKWREILLVFFSSGLAWILARLLKILINTDRPFLALTNVEALFNEPGYAFPSGHAAFFMALGASIYLNHKRAGILFMLFALIIGIARISAGVHFPIDIIGGFVLGALVAFALKKLYPHT